MIGLSAMSFKNVENISNYNEISLNTKILKEIGSFTRYEQDHYASDKTVWYRRMETWTLTGNSGSINDIQNTLAKY